MWTCLFNEHSSLNILYIWFGEAKIKSKECMKQVYVTSTEPEVLRKKHFTQKFRIKFFVKTFLGNRI